MKILLPVKLLFILMVFHSSTFAANISIADATTPNEKAVAQTVVVFMSSAQSFTVEVEYETSDGTAKENEDYTSRSGTITFGPGETVKAIGIPIIDDNLREEKETMFISLKKTSFGSLRDSKAVVYITDDD